MSARLHLWGVMRALQPGQSDLLEAGMFSTRGDRAAMKAACNHKRRMQDAGRCSGVFLLALVDPGVIAIERTV